VGIEGREACGNRQNESEIGENIMKIIVSILMFIFVFCSPGDAYDVFMLTGEQGVIRVVVTGDNVNIRSAPSVKGKAYTQTNSGACFLVASVPVRDESDNSEWYRILFDIDAFGDIIYQTNKMPLFQYANPYISARFVKSEPLSDYDKHALEYFAKGRPPHYQVGENFSESGWFSEDYAWSREVKTPISLYLEPKVGAQRIEAPAGTIVLFDSDHEGRLRHHYDMDDVRWFYVADESGKLIGFVTSEQMDEHFDKDYL